MNIIEETKNIFDIDFSNIELYEKSKKVDIKFDTKKEKLPSEKDLIKYFSLFPNRDNVNIIITFWEYDCFNFSNTIFNSAKYTEFVDSFDKEDICSVKIEISKEIENSIFSVYVLDEFVNNILNDDFQKILLTFSNLLSGQNHLNIQCLELENLFWKTKTIAFLGTNQKNEFTYENRIERLNQIKDNANCTTYENFHLLPDDFKIEINHPDNKLTALFEKISTFLSLIYISSFSTVNNEGFYCEIIGERNIGYTDKFDSLKYNEEIYKIYHWAFSDGNVIDKLLIARNSISLHCKYVKLIDIDERTFESIKSNHQLYLRDNASKYIEAKEQVSKFIIEIISQINENISTLSSEFKNNLIAIIGFFFTTVLINVASEQPLDNVFTEHITKIFEIMIAGSLTYSIISIIYSNSKYKQQISVFNDLKNRYKNILSEVEINEIFDESRSFKNAKSKYKIQSLVFSILWIVFIIIVFIITEYVGEKSLLKHFFEFLSAFLSNNEEINL